MAEKANASERTPPPGLSELRRYTQAQLADLFGKLDAPKEAELSGAYSGVVLSVAMLDRLPDLIRGIVHSAAEAVWKGKSFTAQGGANEWLKVPGGVSLVTYRTYLADGDDGAGRILALDYDVPGNPAPLKRIWGEVKQLDEKTYLARMRYRLGAKGVPILYFALIQE